LPDSSAKAPAPSEQTVIESVGSSSTENEFLDFDLSDLLNVNIESVSKRVEKMIDAPLAVSVLTRAEIRRSGARTIILTSKGPFP